MFSLEKRTINAYAKIRIVFILDVQYFSKCNTVMLREYQGVSPSENFKTNL